MTLRVALVVLVCVALSIVESVVPFLLHLKSARADLLLIEGAGGLLVPYDDQLLGSDLIAALGRPPILLIARTGLGTINHTALTVREAERSGLRVAAIVLNRTVADSAPDPAPEIARITRVPIFGPFPLVPSAAQRDPAALAVLARTALDLPGLYRVLGLPTRRLDA